MSKYKVGQLSKAMGVSSHTIKHYEKFDLVAPVQDNENNYRYYDMRQCNRILESRKFRNIGFALKDISEIMNQYDNQMYNDMLMNRSMKIKEELDHLIYQYDLVSQLCKESIEIDQQIGRWYIEQCSSMLFYKQTDNNKVILENNEYTSIQELLNDMPRAKQALWIGYSSFHSNTKQYQWGICADYESVKQYELDERCRIIEAFRGFVTYIKVKPPFIVGSNRLIDEIKQMFHKFSAAAITEAYSLQYKIVQENGQEVYYFKVMIPLMET